MRSPVRSCLALSCLLSCSAVLPAGYGGGFGLYEGSARANALGGTLVAREADPSSVFYNPAAITQLSGTHVMAGVSVIRPSTDVTTAGPGGIETTGTKDTRWVPPHVYGTHQLNHRFWFGWGVFSRFGLGTEFEEAWPGRYNSYKATIHTLSFNPNLVWKASDVLSLAAGASASSLGFENDRKLHGAAGQDIDLCISGDAVGYGFNLGLRYQVADWLAVGASYQSRVEQEVDGNGDIGVGKTDAQGDITLPDMAFLGVALTPIRKLSVEAGAVYTGWSSYDELSITFDDPALLGTKEISVPKEWDDVWRYAIGAEYALTRKWDLRLGYVYDQEPGPDGTADYMIPGNDRQLYSVGVGCHWDRWLLDLSYTYLDVKDRHISARAADGILESDFEDGEAHIFGISLSAALGPVKQAPVTAP
ncbi:MAG: outer membrane protein transport protein [Verrucomicrobiota bacterium]